MPLRPGPPRLVAGPDTAMPGCDYSDEERGFLVAIEGGQRRYRRPFPTCARCCMALIVWATAAWRRRDTEILRRSHWRKSEGPG